MRRAFIAALVFGLLAWPTVAAASMTAWTWSTQLAERTLRQQGLDFTYDDGSTGHEQVSVADCKGEGRGIRNRFGVLTWRNLTCYVETDAPNGEGAYFIRFHVAGKYRWTYAFLHYANQ
jgi:hypothetical protein